MQQFEIVDAADQEFSAVLENRRVTMRLRHLPAIDRWTLSLSLDDQPVLTGRILVTGRDLIAPFDFGIGGLFVWPEREGAIATYDGLVGGDVTFLHANVADVESARQ